MKNNEPLPLDPHRTREEEKYKSPIFSREYIIDFLKGQNKLFSLEQLLKALGIKKLSAIKAFQNRIKAMIRDRQLKKNNKFIGLFDYVSQPFKGLVSLDMDNEFIITNHDGVNLVISPNQRKMVFIGDEVIANPIGLNKWGKEEAYINEVVKRSQLYVVGVLVEEFQVKKLQPILRHMSTEIILLPGKYHVKANDIVKAKFIIYPTITTPAVVKFVETIDLHVDEGKLLDKFCDLMSYKHSLKDKKNSNTHLELDKLPQMISSTDRQRRTDLTHLNFVTIDSYETQDIDDAIYVQGNNLYVAIADVGHYVKRNSALDLYAKTRASSIYFPRNTKHMLPEVLSQDLCSLQPHQDRLVLVCEMKFNKTGSTIISTKIYEAIIRSRANLTYHDVTDFLLHAGSLGNKMIEQQIQHCYELYQKISHKMDGLGRLSFETNESYLVFDKETNIIKDITLSKPTIAHKIIEQFMIHTNESVSKYVSELNLPCIYRVNTPPTEDKIKNLINYIKINKIRFPNLKPTVLSLGKLLEYIKNHNNYHIITIMVMRTLNAAYYSAQAQGHFALNLKYYSHFTSPIRRYADLILHRIIKHHLKTQEGKQYTEEELESTCSYISQQSRNIDYAENDVRKFLKFNFLRQFIGHVFIATISLANTHGLFAYIARFDVEATIVNSPRQTKLVPGNAVQAKLVKVDPMILLLQIELV